MSQLPQIVKERLRASSSGGAHPDADVLTAFSERSLPANERAVVMEHLARCGDCREILALALPASESVNVVAVDTVRTSPAWLSWPALRWGFALAGVAIVAGIGVVEYQQRARSTEMAYSKNSATEKIALATPVSSPAAETKTSVSQPATSEKDAPARTMSDENAGISNRPAPQIRYKSESGPDSSASSGVASYADSRQGLRANERKPDAAMKPAPAESAAPAPPPSAYPAASTQPQASSDLAKPAPAQKMSETVEVQSQATTVTTEDQAQDLSQKQLDLPRAQQQRASGDPIYFRAEGDKDKEMSRAKAAVPQSLENANGTVGGSIQSVTGRNLRPLTSPTWNISSAGALQRSLDGGKAWEDVDPTSVRLMNSQTSLSVAALAKAPQENKKENRKEKADAVDRMAQGSSAVTFRAVSANAFDVWAGGSGGALYHSVDGGNQWTRVFPTANSVVLTGDIASIQFSDPEHGTVTTTASELWTTTDGGHSWQKR